MAATATLAEGSPAVIVEDFQMQSALVFPDEDAYADAGRRVQVPLDDAEDSAARRVRILSRGDGEEGWTLHAEGRVQAGSAAPPQAASPLDIEGLKAALAPVDLAAYYRAKLAVGIDLGPSFRTVEGLWARQGEAITEVALPAGVERSPPRRASAPARRLLPGIRRCAQPGGRRRGSYLLALRVGAAVAQGPPAGASGLPRANAPRP